MNIDKLNPQSNFGIKMPIKYFITGRVETDIPSIEYKKVKDQLIITPFNASSGMVLKDEEWGSVALSPPNQYVTNLGTYQGVDSVEGILVTAKNIILHGALEAIEDFRPLLKKLRWWLNLSSENSLEYIPLNLEDYNPKSFYRYWDSLDKIKDLFISMGFEVRVKDDGRSSLQIGFSNKTYSEFLRRNNMPKNFKHLLISTEHSDYRIKGGLGSYIKECCDLYGYDAGMLKELKPQLLVGKLQIYG